VLRRDSCSNRRSLQNENRRERQTYNAPYNALGSEEVVLSSGFERDLIHCNLKSEKD
jgi:hypothetical protein